MNYKIFLSVMMMLSIFSTQAVNVQSSTILFAKDQSTLSTIEKNKLTDLADAEMIWLYGHTDKDGDLTYNQQLSKKRVETAKEYLIDLGINPNKITTQFAGENEPINQQINEQEKSLNRRVDVLYSTDPLLSFEVEKQTFLIDNSIENTIVGNEGTKVTIPKGVFDNLTEVSISLEEYYDPLAILSSNLTTKSGNQPIESSGMINIEAYDGSRKINLNGEIEIAFKKMNEQEDFQIFTGNPTASMTQDWVASAQNDFMEYEDLNPINYFQYGNESICTTTGDIFEEWSEGGWAEFCLDVDVYDVEIASCYQDAHILATIGKNGLTKSIVTNFEEKGQGCDLYFKNHMKKHLPKSFKSKDKMYESTIDMTFEIDWQGDSSLLIAQDKIEDFDDTYYTQYEANSIIMNSTQLGWINCDRFLKEQNLVTFNAETSPEANVRLVLKDYNAFFNGGREDENGKWSFKKVPQNAEAYLIATSKVDSETLLSIEEVSLSGKTNFTDFSYKKVTKAELKEAIENLDL